MKWLLISRKKRQFEKAIKRDKAGDWCNESKLERGLYYWTYSLVFCLVDFFPLQTLIEGYNTRFYVIIYWAIDQAQISS
jgi:hypothetical protein